MKILLLTVSCLLIATSALPGATPEELIATGRDWLTKKNLTNALTNFKAAAELAPNDPVANVFYGTTRLLVLPEISPVSEFLERLGADPRYHRTHDWHPDFPRDNRGHLVVPPGLNAQEAASLLRGAVLRELAAADLNFGKVHDTNFVLSLTKAETTISAVTVDYGDVLLVRSTLNVLQYLCYTLNSWNTDLLLEDATNRNQTSEQFLARHPELLRFTTTNDLADARRVFERGIELYFEGSAFIRNRAWKPNGLFRFDEEVAPEERHFRLLLADIREALNAPTVLSDDKGLTAPVIDLRPHFSGSVSPREMFPQFKANDILAGTLPDPKFGGIYSHNDRADIEGRLSSMFEVVPSLSVQRDSRKVLLHSRGGESYGVDFSFNLNEWYNLGHFASSDNNLWITNLPTVGDSIFVRAEELATPVNDRFASRALVAGSPTYLRGDARLARTDPRTGRKSLWWTWTAPASGWVQVERLTGSEAHHILFYTGSSENNLILVSEGGAFHVSAGTTVSVEIGGGYAPLAYRLTLQPPPPNDNYANRIQLTGTSARLRGSTIGGTLEPGETNHIDWFGDSNSTVWWSWRATQQSKMLLSKNDLSRCAAVAIYRNYGHANSTRLKAGFLPIVFDAMPGAIYDIVVVECPYAPGEIDLRLEPIATPPNDYFANRNLIPVTDAVVTGTLFGSTYESGEAGSLSDNIGSIWWSWTAPTNGTLLISPQGSDGSPWNIFNLYVGNSIPQLALISVADYARPIIFQSVTNGVTYNLRASGYPGKTGEIVFRLRFTPRL